MKALTIIGNGFDLGHNLPTRFYDFIQSDYEFQEKYQIFKGTNWNELESNYKELLRTIMSNRPYGDPEEELDEILSNSDYEKYGYINYSSISSEKYIKEINEIKELIKLLSNFEKDFLSYLLANCNKDKLQSVYPRNKVLQILKSSSDIINFNYTQVIEEVYQIQHVNHIHGSINEGNIAIGTAAVDELKESLVDLTSPTKRPCENKYDFQEKMKYCVEDMDGHLHEDDTIKSMFYEIGHNIEKNEHQLFELVDKKNKEALSSRQHLEDKLKKEKYDAVFILGHSLGEADMSVFKQINKDAKIYCYYYEHMDNRNFKIMKDNLYKLGNDFELIPNNDLYDI